MSAQSKPAAHLVAEAKSHAARLSPENVAAAMRHGDALLVDIRESEERAEYGLIAGTIRLPRGMLKFAADQRLVPGRIRPRAPHHPVCATGARAVLAADVLRQLGYADIAFLGGGCTAWSAGGLGIEAHAKQPPSDSECER